MAHTIAKRTLEQAYKGCAKRPKLDPNTTEQSHKTVLGFAHKRPCVSYNLNLKMVGVSHDTQWA